MHTDLGEDRAVEQKVRTIIIDDDTFVCVSLKTILQADPQIEVLATGTDGASAVQLYRELHPDILLMDIQMTDMSGLEAGETILREDHCARILYLTTFSDNEYIIKALRMGARGYLIKQEIEAIAPAMKAVMSGQSVFGSEIVTKLPSLMQQNGSPENRFVQLGIQDRELEVIRLVAKGLNNREIAKELCLSEGTVRNYLTVILDKLGLRDRTQLAVFYFTGSRQH